MKLATLKEGGRDGRTGVFARCVESRAGERPRKDARASATHHGRFGHADTK